jgi:hypothetical protein
MIAFFSSALPATAFSLGSIFFFVIASPFLLSWVPPKRLRRAAHTGLVSERGGGMDYVLAETFTGGKYSKGKQLDDAKSMISCKVDLAKLGDARIRMRYRPPFPRLERHPLAG